MPQAKTYASQRANRVTNSYLDAGVAGSGLTGLAYKRARWEDQSIKASRALADYAGQLAQDDLLLIRRPGKTQEGKRARA